MADGYSIKTEAQLINERIQMRKIDTQLDSNLISDGYHTFGELYEHRVMLFIKLCEYYLNYNSEQPVWRSKKHSDGQLAYDGWFIMGIGTEPGKQITYHLPIAKWDDTNFADTLEQAPPFDLHTPSDVLKRIALL